MPAILTFFPVGCGDMTLIRLADDQTSILIDVNIRAAADDPDDPTRDVAADLRSRLKRDVRNRPYVDAFLLSHPDQDHCRGIQQHFWLGPIADYPDDNKPDGEKRIVIGEVWSSPIVFRRASRNHKLCDDALAFQLEAKRRVARYRSQGSGGLVHGERILILGEDQDGKADNLGAVLVKIDTRFTRVNAKETGLFEALLLGPLPVSDDDDECLLSKNHSSTVLNIKLAASAASRDACRFLSGGDAEVLIWERLWERHRGQIDDLTYDLLLAPHHCSWHSLSHDSWAELRERAQVSPDARYALSQTRDGASVVSSSEPIKDDDNDPPCIRAKREYVAIAESARGFFWCTGEYPNQNKPQPLEFSVGEYGPRRIDLPSSAAAILTASRAHRAGWRRRTC